MEGRTLALGWPNASGQLEPIAGAMSPGATLSSISIGWACPAISPITRGTFTPNKAPGTSLMSVPAYFVLYQFDGLLGLDPDGWRVLTVNAWLTSVFSVGLLSSFGVVLLFRFASQLSGDEEAAAVTAVIFAFGTMYFSYATMLFEHNIIAVALLAAWSLLSRTTDASNATGRLLGAGICAGCGAITNYIMVIPLLMLGAYALSTKRVRGGLLFGTGVLAPFLLICGYNLACFGTPFTTNYRYENPMFLAASGAFLGVFGTPDLSVLIKILVSPFRGLFVTSPALIIGVAGLWKLWQTERLRRDAVLCIAVLGFFLLFNVCFNGWHGGFAAGPRYLAPALPFLMVPSAFAYRRWTKISIVLGGISIAATFVITAVDPQPPVGNSTIAEIPGRAQWTYNPLTEYELPLMFAGRASPLLADMQRRAPTAAPSSFVLSTITGPVSANPVGVYEGDYFQRFKPGSPQAEGNSFNVGELLAPNSLWSLVPLLAISGGLLLLLRREIHRPATLPGSPLPTR